MIERNLGNEIFERTSWGKKQVIEAVLRHSLELLDHV